MEKEVHDLVTGINNYLKEGPDYNSGRSWTICRVPKNMLDVYRNAYVPQIISIGPFHYGDQGLQGMKEHKKRFLLRLLGRQFQENGEQAEEPPVPQVHNASRLEDGEQAEEMVLPQERKPISLEDLTTAMMKLKNKTRECYSEAINITRFYFVPMMIVDGCFVVELLRLYYKFTKKEYVDDPIFTTRGMLRTLQRDLLKLENQLPFFVLEELFKLTRVAEEPSLIELTVTFFDPLLPRKNIIQKLNREEKFDHLLGVFRSTFLSSVEDKITKSGWKQLQTNANIPLVEEGQLIHCVMKLQETGVKFKKREESELLDINFKGGELQIPPLYIDDNTLPLFLNFVAYEQCDHANPFFTNFIMFFDSLINTPKDVEILHKKGIINHDLGSNEDVANLFNKLGREIFYYDLNEFYLSEQMEGVNNYCETYQVTCNEYYATKWHDWLTSLKRDYFSSPWTFLSLLAAITLLILTAVQTSYALIAYYRPR